MIAPFITEAKANRTSIIVLAVVAIFVFAIRLATKKRTAKNKIANNEYFMYSTYDSIPLNTTETKKKFLSEVQQFNKVFITGIER